MTTKREREINLLRRQIGKLESMRNGAIAALVHCELTLPIKRKQLERKLKYARLKLHDGPLPDASVAQDPSPVPAAHVAEDRSPGDDMPAPVQDKTGDEPLARQLDDIPEFLRRGMAAQRGVDAAVYEAAHAVANAHNRIPTKEEKALVATEKAKVRKEHKHAELTGQRRKTPLTGRAAEAFLRGRATSLR